MVTERAVDRRAFVKLSGLTAGGIALSGGAVVAGVVGHRRTAGAQEAESANRTI